MTLNTKIYVLDPVDPEKLFKVCQPLVNPGNRVKNVVSYGGPKAWSPGEAAFGNELGQGLDAILHVSYCPDGPLVTQEQSEAHEEYCEDDCDGGNHDPAHCLKVSFDTGYGYSDEQGRGCGDLHASYIVEIGQWLDAQGVRWAWEKEYTGEVHGGADRYERLIDLCTGGFEAKAWMQNTVLPAIVNAAAHGQL